MILPMFAINDIKAHAFNQPALSANEETVKRSFYEMLVNGNDPIMKFSPNDFSLYKIGEFDTEKGIVKPCFPIEFIASGGDLYAFSNKKEDA